MKNIKFGSNPLDLSKEEIKVDWQAWWLQDPVFKDAPFRKCVHPDRTPSNNSDLKNIHSLFRKEFELPEKEIKNAYLYITADDCYKLYINGDFIGAGPAPSYTFDFPYNGWDVTNILNSDSLNCLGVHVYYQGLHSLAFVSADNLQGFLFQLQIEFADGDKKIICSDDSWKCYQTGAYETRQTYGYETSFSEHIDLRKYPAGWRKVGFNDHDWKAPNIGKVKIPDVYRLTPQITPPVFYEKVSPLKIVPKGRNGYLIDFGSEIVGEMCFNVTGHLGQVVEVRHAEEMEDEHSVKYKMRCYCDYQEFCTLSGRKKETLEFFDYKGFRYVEVLNWPEELVLKNVWANQRHYPFPADACHFSSSNDLLNDIWKICAKGVEVGTMDTYLDCPTREKGGFVGDGFITGLAHLILTGDERILKKFLKDVANSSSICSGLLAVAPSNVGGELAEYSMLWPVLLEYYYQWTGDIEFVVEQLPVLNGLIDYYEGFENKDGLLQDLIGKSSGTYAVLVDWPRNFLDNYDDPMISRQVRECGIVNTMINGYYVGMLNSAINLMTFSEQKGRVDRLKSKRDLIRKNCLKFLYNEKAGLFVDRLDSDHSALHANVLPLLNGFVTKKKRGQIIAFLKSKRMNCGVYFSFFLLKSLFNCGETELGYDLLTSKDLHSWSSMLKAGATTCMEVWDPDLKKNTSWCHPWSSAPIFMVTREVFGLNPSSPGWEIMGFSPQIPRDLESAEIKLTTPKGIVKVSFEQSKEEIVFNLIVPKNGRVKCVFKNIKKNVIVDNIREECVITQNKFELKEFCLPAELNSGEHVIKVFKVN